MIYQNTVKIKLKIQTNKGLLFHNLINLIEHSYNSVHPNTCYHAITLMWFTSNTMCHVRSREIVGDKQQGNTVSLGFCGFVLKYWFRRPLWTLLLQSQFRFSKNQLHSIVSLTILHKLTKVFFSDCTKYVHCSESNVGDYSFAECLFIQFKKTDNPLCFPKQCNCKGINDWFLNFFYETRSSPLKEDINNEILMESGTETV
jgi:hypothetical protein